MNNQRSTIFMKRALSSCILLLCNDFSLRVSSLSTVGKKRSNIILSSKTCMPNASTSTSTTKRIPNLPSSGEDHPNTPEEESSSMTRRNAILKPTTFALAGVLSTTLPNNNPIAHATTTPPSSVVPTTTSQIPTGGQRVALAGPTSPPSGFPLASFGLQIYDDETAYKLTTLALEAGYRNFFASVLAGNQRGFARAIRDSLVPRDELYICGTVLSNRARGENAAYLKTQRGCDENMAAFAVGNIDKLDMIMLDYPGPDSESIGGQWKAFEEMRQNNLVTSLAVSNFSPKQLDDIVLWGGKGVTMPTVNQLPYSLSYHPESILEYNRKRGILVQSWSPLSRALPKYGSTLAAIGKKYDKSAAQVALRWIVQNRASFCMQSKKLTHFEENLNVFDFVLTDQEMAQLTALEPPRAAIA